MTLEELKKKRLSVSKKQISNKNIVHFKRYDKRPTDSTRVCCVCGRPLTKVNLATGQVITDVEHKQIAVGCGLKVHVCYYIKSCKTYLRWKGDLEESES